MLVTDRGDNLGDTFEMLMTVLLPVSRIIVADFGTAYFSFAYFLCTFSNMFWTSRGGVRISHVISSRGLFLVKIELSIIITIYILGRLLFTMLFGLDP